MNDGFDTERSGMFEITKGRIDRDGIRAHMVFYVNAPLQKSRLLGQAQLRKHYLLPQSCTF